MNAPLELAHSPFGGSVAARVLRCPASVGLVAKVPAYLHRTSSYAERGTALHSAMVLLIDENEDFESLVGKTINDYTITRDDVENTLPPVYAYIAPLLDAPGAGFFLEQRVAFSTIPGAFGTCDLLVRIGNTVHVIDFKFGAGVRVLALYPDPDDDGVNILNAQLMFYAAAARDSLPNLFAGVSEIALTILQPQSIELGAELVSSVVATHAELDEFIPIYRAACAEALSEAPRLKRGAHCRFCGARPICPEHAGALLDLAQFVMPLPTAEDYYRALGAGLDLVDAVKEISTALRDQTKQALEAGHAISGWALSEGRAVRSWQDEAAVAPALLRLGLMRDDVIEETLRSPAQVEKRARARNVTVPKELISSKPSGVSLVKAKNARSLVLGRGEIVRAFTEALSAFQKGEGHT
jgi:uncharacterized protein DUF2800